MTRTTRPWVSYFGPSKQINGVTLSEYETVNRSFHESIAQYLGLRYEERADSAYITMTISGRGKNAVIAFPRATYAVAFTAQEAGAATWLAGSWEATYESNGKYTLRHDGQPFVAADYELSFDELVFKNETTPTGVGCSAPGRYRWTVNPANGNLSLGRIADDCANRVLFLTRRALSKKG
jgi:ABC-type transport system substrate-binding protein